MRNTAYDLDRTSFFTSFFKTVRAKDKVIDDADEAEEAAWQDRWSLLKTFIKNNADKINELMTEDDE